MESAEPIMDGALLRAFAAFAEERNFTRAARRVGLSQPALFERVQRLQALLELPLYRREGRALVLTEQGVRLAAHARETQGAPARRCASCAGSPPMRASPWRRARAPTCSCWARCCSASRRRAGACGRSRA